MGTSQDTIRIWLENAKAKNATHLIVVCDTFDWSDYPVLVAANEDVRSVAASFQGKNMQKVMEVYSLSIDIDTQLSEFRAFHYE